MGQVDKETRKSSGKGHVMTKVNGMDKTITTCRKHLLSLLKDKRKEAQDIAESLFDPIRVKIQKETLDLEKQLTMLHQIHTKIDAKAHAKIESLNKMTTTELQTLQKNYQQWVHESMDAFDAAQKEMVATFTKKINALK